MLNEDVLKEYIFDCEMRKLSKRTIQTYRNVNVFFIVRSPFGLCLSLFYVPSI